MNVTFEGQRWQINISLQLLLLQCSLLWVFTCPLTSTHVKELDFQINSDSYMLVFEVVKSNVGHFV